MKRQNEKARNLLQQEPGRGRSHEKSTSLPQLPQTNRARQKTHRLFDVTTIAGDEFRISVSGRDRWALDRLREAGPKGCTPITQPAPRWSAYVFNLRAQGLEIETMSEPHGGQFPGHHARYVLRSAVSIVAERGTA